MSDEPLETRELQEAIDELHEEKEEREAEEKKNSWAKYIGLTTVILAVFAAIGSFQAGSLENDQHIHLLQASDSWNEYQASKEKGHLYTIKVNEMLDAGLTVSAAPVTSIPAPQAPRAASLEKPKAGTHVWRRETPQQRIAEYQSEIAKEEKKQGDLSKKAKSLTRGSEREHSRHEKFSSSVMLIQIAIALGAIAAIAKNKYIWYLSLLSGAAGVVFFMLGWR